MTTYTPVDAPPAATRPGRPPRGTLMAQDRRLGYILIAPTMALLLLVTAFPLAYNIWNSFFYSQPTNPLVNGRPAGTYNYRQLFNPDTPYPFVPALEHTVFFTVVSVAIEVVLGLALALALNKPFRGRGLVRAAVFIPWAVPTVVSAQIWKGMFDPRQGFVDYLLKSLHLPGATTTWLASTDTTWAVIFAADAWKNTPFVAIVLIGGLQVIPNEIYEAARLDGASAWRQFRRLTLPLLRPALMVALIFRTMSAFLIFDVVYIIDRGGPGTSTTVLAFNDYTAFQTNLDYGYGGALSIVLTVMALAIAAGYTRLMRERS